MNLLWDGSDLGNITENFVSITEPKEGRVGSELVIKTANGNITCLAWKYKNDVPLVVDELKPVFGLKKIGRHKCIIKKVKLLIARYDGGNAFDEKLDECDVETMREHLIFRHLFGVTNYGEYMWLTLNGEIISYKETMLTYKKKSSDLQVCKVKRWFGADDELVGITMSKLLSKFKNRKKLGDQTPNYRIIQLISMEVRGIICRVSIEISYMFNGFLSRLHNYILNIE